MSPSRMSAGPGPSPSPRVWVDDQGPTTRRAPRTTHLRRLIPGGPVDIPRTDGPRAANWLPDRWQRAGRTCTHRDFRPWPVHCMRLTLKASCSSRCCATIRGGHHHHEGDCYALARRHYRHRFGGRAGWVQHRDAGCSRPGPDLDGRDELATPGRFDHQVERSHPGPDSDAVKRRRTIMDTHRSSGSP
jgi:hypothetical protein